MLDFATRLITSIQLYPTAWVFDILFLSMAVVVSVAIGLIIYKIINKEPFNGREKENPC